MTLKRSISLSVVLAVAAMAPAAAIAKNGADDPPSVVDDNGGLRAPAATDDPASAVDDKGGLRAPTATDDPATVIDDKGGQRDDTGGRDNSESRSGNRRGKRTAGQCTGHSTSKLKVKPDGSRLETEFEVDQNRSGVTWKATIRRNGRVAVQRNMTTHAPSGSWSLERRLGNGSGADRITARATSPSGEVCTASLSI